MKKSKLIQYYAKVIDRLEKYPFNRFICIILSQIAESFEDEKYLMNHFESNFPFENLHVEIYNSELFIRDAKNYVCSSWFKDGIQDKSLITIKECIKLRIQLIESIIKNLENE